MPFKAPSIPGKSVLAAVMSGLAAAVMVAAAARHLSLDGKLQLGMPVPGRQLLPMLLVFLAPLPLMITSVGFGTFAGLIAAVVGAVAFGGLAPILVGGGLAEHNTLALAGMRGLGFGVMFGIPALLLGSLAGRPAPPLRASDPVPGPGTMRPDERLIGRVLTATIAVASVIVACVAIMVIQAKGGYGAVVQELVKEIQPLVAADLAAKKIDPALAARIVSWSARLLVWFAGLTVAAEVVCLFALNVWLAGRIAQTSGLLAQPWPDLPQNLRVPRSLAIVAAVAFGLSFAGGLVGLVSVIVAGAVMAGFAFQGLAVVHALTRGLAWRTTILASIYLALSFLPPLMMLIFAAVGLCDAAFFFRDRKKPVVEKKPGPWS